jgi:pimeloyl-ACP methyl ester carboxylesterase
VYDAFIGGLAVLHATLEQLKVPTLLVCSTDDSLATYAHAEAAAAGIPGVEFVTLERGGRRFLSHEPDVRAAVGTSLTRRASAFYGWPARVDGERRRPPRDHRPDLDR